VHSLRNIAGPLVIGVELQLECHIEFGAAYFADTCSLTPVAMIVESEWQFDLQVAIKKEHWQASGTQTCTMPVPLLLAKHGGDIFTS
jgi:hypothetical protein